MLGSEKLTLPTAEPTAVASDITTAAIGERVVALNSPAQTDGLFTSRTHTVTAAVSDIPTFGSVSVTDTVKL